MNVIIPIGGIGKRFQDDGYFLPKPLIKALGKPVIFWNIENLKIKEEDIVYIVYREEFKIFNFESVLRNKFRKINFRFIPIKNDTRGASETVLYALEDMSKEELSEVTAVIDSDNFYGEDVLYFCREKPKNIIFFKKDFSKTPIYSYIKIENKDKVSQIVEKEKISDNACVGSYCFKSGNLLKETIKSVILEGIKQKDEFYISSIYKFFIDKGIEVHSKEIKEFNCLGTPIQLKSFSSNLNTSEEKYRFCFDLDNTLVSYPEIEGDYGSVKPLQKNIDFLNFLHSQGHTIIVHTARRMKTHSGNVGKVQSDIGKITFDTLDRFGIKYDEIYFGKPYAHFYIDDLSVKAFDDLEKETGFYNIHPDSRDHNRIEIFDNYIIKYSELIEGEKYYYQNIPEKFSNLFPAFLDHGKDFIKISKIQGIPVSFINSNNLLNQKNLIKIFESLNDLHSHECTEGINMYSNYFDKVRDRIEKYDFSSYEGYFDFKKSILNFLKEYELEDRGELGMIHGDPVFTNIILDNRDNLKFIDMRGKIGNKKTIFGDIFYDWAKVYQSILGYDHILTGKEIDRDYIQKNKEIFDLYIIDKFGNHKLNDIKWITKSLLISLIPIHNSEKCKDYYELIRTI